MGGGRRDDRDLMLHRRSRAGALTAAARRRRSPLRARLGELELVRRIYVAVRDRNWNTIPGVSSELEVGASATIRSRRASRSGTRATTPTSSGAAASSARRTGASGFDDGRARGARHALQPRRLLRPPAVARVRRAAVPGDDAGRAGRPASCRCSSAPQRFENGVYVPLFPSVSRLEVDYDGGPTAVVRVRGRPVRDRGPAQLDRRVVQDVLHAARARLPARAQGGQEHLAGE